MNANNELARIRQHVLDRFNNGTLGVLAARAGVAESVLREWRGDISRIPSASEVEALKVAIDGPSPSTDVDSVDREFDPAN